MHKLMLDQKAEIERLNKKEAEDRQAIELLKSRLKTNEGTSPPPQCRFLNMPMLF
jgi:hypothetical protein